MRSLLQKGLPLNPNREEEEEEEEDMEGQETTAGIEPAQAVSLCLELGVSGPLSWDNGVEGKFSGFCRALGFRSLGFINSELP